MSPLLPALLLLATPVLYAAEVLIEDDFENGFNPGWAQRSPGVTIVEDETAPGNHVARITKPRDGFKTIPLNPAQTESHADELEKWRDYELSFRFRIGSTELDPTINRRHHTLLHVAVNTKPEPDNPYEQRGLLIQALRSGSRAWQLRDPRVSWYKKAERFEKVLFRAPRSWQPPVDTAWHRIRVISRDQLCVVYFDDDELFRAEDSRATYGGVVITAPWDPAIIDPKFVDIDDIRVVKLPAVPENSKTTPQASLKTP